MPLRSTGCHKCRQRKIRCDETRPGCLKCATHGVVCPGYKTDRKGDVEFRDQTFQTVQRIEIDGTARNSVQRKPSKAQQRQPNKSNSLAIASKLDHDGVQRKPKSRQLTVPASHDTLRHALPVVPLQALPSPAVNRMRLYDTFMQIYVPQNALAQDRGLFASNAEFIGTLVTLPSGQPSLSHALDALSLVQIGSVRKDKHVVNKAIEAYIKALRGLAFALSKPENLQDDTTLATACILSTCEFYTDFRLQGYTWVTHQQGMLRLIEARGPASILKSRLALHLFYQSTSSSLAMSLLMRKRDPYTADRWAEVIEAEIEMNDDHSKSYRLGLDLPGLLERHDVLLSSQSMSPEETLQQLDELLAECESMEAEMKGYLADHHARTAADDKAWVVLAGVEDFHPYAELVSDRTLNRAFRFPSFQTAFVLCSHWLRMFMLRQTIQSLHGKRQILVPGWRPLDEHVVEEREILCYILNMVRQVPYFTEAASGATGEMCCFYPLFIAEQYFCARGHWHWVRWVQHVSGRIFRKGMSTPFADYSVSIPPFYDADERAEIELGFNWIESPAVPVLDHADRVHSPQGHTVWKVRSSKSTSTSPSESSTDKRSPP